MTLRDLLRELPRATVSGPLDAEVTSVTADSRQAGPGTVFVAIRGHAADGNQFIESAKDRGAVAVVSERAPDLDGITGHECGMPRQPGVDEPPGRRSGIQAYQRTLLHARG